MLYVIIARDKPDSLDLRLEKRPEHLAFLADAGDRVKVAGPLLSPGGDGAPIGSMIVIDAASDGAIQLFTENDPYAKAGLFDSVEVRPWRAAVGDWVPQDPVQG